MGQSVSIYEKENLQGLLPPVIYGPLIPSPPGSNVASASLHNTMTSSSTVVITGNTPGEMDFTQTIDWPTGIQNPHQQYVRYILRFHVKVKPCPSPTHGRSIPQPKVSEGPGAPPTEAPTPEPAPATPAPEVPGMETIHAKPHNITLCPGQTVQIPEPEPMQGLLPNAEYGPLTPANSGVATASIHNTMSSQSTVFITGVSPGQVTLTQEVYWPTGVMSPRQGWVRIIVTFNVTVKPCPSPRPRRPVHLTVPKPTDPPMNVDPRFTPATPQPGNGSGSETGWVVPPASGATSQVTFTILDNTHPGPKNYYTLITDKQGHKSFWHGVTDALGFGHLRLPQVEGGIASFMLFQSFDRTGQPDDGGTCMVGDPGAHIPQTQPITNPPAGNPAITEGGSAYERGGPSYGEFQLHARGIDPLDTHVVVDGSTNGVHTLATSDQAVVGQLSNDLPLGRHAFGIESDGVMSNQFPADVVGVRFDPVPPSEIGQVQTVTVHFDGLPPQDQAVADFSVGGPVQFTNGAAFVTVPVQAATAHVEIRRIAKGVVPLRVHLRVAIAGFWSL